MIKISDNTRTDAAGFSQELSGLCKWPGPIRPHHPSMWEPQPCIAEQCADQIRQQRNLPPGTPVAVFISCSCPKCTPYV